MKYALISEEQIKEIQDALIPSTGIFLDLIHRVLAIAALAIIQSLKPSEPVVYMQDSIELYVKDHLTDIYTIPLFALEQSNE